jgi:TRAP-type uncharacterized transport system substrate-binding protein
VKIIGRGGNRVAETIHPPTMRARLILDVANELAAASPFRHVHVSFPDAVEPLVFSNASTPDAIAEVVAGETTLAILNPSAALTVAYRGYGAFAAPERLRTIAVMPSYDQLVFAVRPNSGVASFADLAAVRAPLKIGVRGDAMHALQGIIDDVLAVTGTTDAVTRRPGGGIPTPDSAKFGALVAGELDGIFDEGAGEWLDAALAAGMRVLALDDVALAGLEALGYRRGLLERSRFPRLAGDVTTLDFSGWILYVRDDAPDDLVGRICAALEARQTTIPWDGAGPLPVERMCTNAPDAPFDVPLHPAAERFWRSRGYLT